MQIPTAETLLHVWELGAEARAEERGTLLLQVARPATSRADLELLPLGRRNEVLLALYATLFGAEVDGVADCPTCGETVEVALPLPTRHALGGDDGPPEPLAIAAGGYDMELRLPTIDDLRGLPEADVDEAIRALLDRCLLAIRRDGVSVTGGSLPAEVIEQVGEAMGAADPHGVIELVTTCPACRATATLGFDPATFLWAELHRWAGHTLREVHQLASAYGWDESAILAMSPTRRRTYLELLPA